ncbi:MAG: DNA polymerase III subunit delta [Acidobacteriota bacterium]|nr:DNA polymerase III subunit delta [Acidobacteriota bacterium]
MKPLTPEAFMQAVAGGQIDPLYLFTGPISQPRKSYGRDEPEVYLQRQAVRALKRQTLDPHLEAFNLSVFSAAEATLSEIVDAARQLPAFSSRRLVLVYDLDRALKSGSDSELAEVKPVADSPGVQQLIEYLKRPQPTTTMVFFYDRPDRRLNLTTALFKGCTVVEFAPLSEMEARAWAKQYLRQRDCAADDATLGLLIGRTGTNLTLLAHELDKLTTYVRRGLIGRAEVDALVPQWKRHTNFELNDKILARDTVAALKLLRHLLANREEPVMILGAIARLYRQMALAKDLMAQGAPAAELAKAIGMSPYAAGEFNKHVRRIQMHEILRGIGQIAAVDRAIKSSLGAAALQLEFLVYELCNPHETSDAATHRPPAEWA